MQELGVRAYQPRNGSTEEISICLGDLVDLLLVYFGSTFCQVEFKHVGIFENLVNDESILASRLVDLKPEKSLFNLVGISPNALPPVFELVQTRRISRFANPLRCDVDRCFLIRPFVIVFYVPKEIFAEHRRYMLRLDGISNRL
jgi:hypothetical protein